MTSQAEEDVPDSNWFGNVKTRCRPSKGRRCIPDVDIEVHVETYLKVDLSSSAQVKIQVKFNFKLKKKIKFFGYHVVVLVKPFSLTYQLLM